MMRRAVVGVLAHPAGGGSLSTTSLSTSSSSSLLRGFASSSASNGWFRKSDGGVGGGGNDAGARAASGGSDVAADVVSSSSASSSSSSWSSMFRSSRVGETATDAATTSGGGGGGGGETTTTSMLSGGVGEDALSSSSASLSSSSSSFDPVGLAASAIETVHATTGLPWWATIACGAVVVRCALFPAVAKQARAGALLNTAIARARGPDGKPPKSFGDIVAAAMELRRRTGGTHIAWLVGGPLIQLPVFITSVLAVRRLAAQPGIGLETGGALWFADLTQAAIELDTLSAPMGTLGAFLPCATAGALFLNINNSFGKIAETSGPAAFLKLAMEWLTVPTLMIGLQLPQAVHCYWLPASLSALAQGAIMRTEAARRVLAIDPKLPTGPAVAGAGAGAGAGGGAGLVGVGGVGGGGGVMAGAGGGGAGVVPLAGGLGWGPPPSSSSSEAEEGAGAGVAGAGAGAGAGARAGAASLVFSRPLMGEEARLVKAAAEAKADKNMEEAVRLLEQAAALGPAPGVENTAHSSAAAAAAAGAAGAETVVAVGAAGAAGDDRMGDVITSGARRSKEGVMSGGGRGEGGTSSGGRWREGVVGGGGKKGDASSSPRRLDPDAHPTVLFALGQTRAALKRWRQSAEAYDACAAVETNPEQRARALAGAGVARANLGELASAATNLEAAIDLRAGDVTSMLSLAAVHKRAGAMDSALEVLARAEKLVPEVRERFIEPLEKELARGGVGGGGGGGEGGGGGGGGNGKKNARGGGRKRGVGGGKSGGRSRD